MPHREARRQYTRRLNSNGGDVAPAICATICKGVQRQLDNSGSYVLDFYRVNATESLCPIESHRHGMIQYTTSETKTRTIKQGENNGSKPRQNS